MIKLSNLNISSQLDCGDKVYRGWRCLGSFSRGSSSGGQHHWQDGRRLHARNQYYTLMQTILKLRRWYNFTYRHSVLTLTLHSLPIETT